MQKKMYNVRRVLAAVLVLAILLTSIQLEGVQASAAEKNFPENYELVNLEFTESVPLPYVNQTTLVTANLTREHSDGYNNFCNRYNRTSRASK